LMLFDFPFRGILPLFLSGIVPGYIMAWCWNRKKFKIFIYMLLTIGFVWEVHDSLFYPGSRTKLTTIEYVALVGGWVVGYADYYYVQK
jgi:hypothetical protein